MKKDRSIQSMSALRISSTFSSTHERSHSTPPHFCVTVCLHSSVCPSRGKQRALTQIGSKVTRGGLGRLSPRLSAIKAVALCCQSHQCVFSMSWIRIINYPKNNSECLLVLASLSFSSWHQLWRQVRWWKVNSVTFSSILGYVQIWCTLYFTIVFPLTFFLVW